MEEYQRNKKPEWYKTEKNNGETHFVFELLKIHPLIKNLTRLGGWLKNRPQMCAKSNTFWNLWEYIENRLGLGKILFKFS